MKLATLAAIAGLTTAMAHGATAIPADAGNMSKKHGQQHGSKKQHRQVTIDPNISTKNLHLLEEKLHGRTRKHVEHEILRRARSGRAARERNLDEFTTGLSKLRGADAILGIGIAGQILGTKKGGGGGHGH